MPRYFFHVSHVEPRVDDEIGTELADRKAAWDQATLACGEMIKEIDGDLAQGTDWCMEVCDEDGPAFEIHFGAENSLVHPNGKPSIDDILEALKHVRRMVVQSGFRRQLSDTEALLSVVAAEVKTARVLLVGNQRV